MEEYKENENITDTNAIVGMILGILSVILCWVPVIGLVLGIIALILSIKGLKNSKIIAPTKNSSRNWTRKKKTKRIKKRTKNTESL